MYNEERKQEFLKYVERDLNLTFAGFSSLFKKTEKYEEFFQKDLCDFVFEEISKLLSVFSASSTGALIKNISFLRKYTNWCCTNNLSTDNINHYDELDTSVGNLKKYTNKESSVCPSRERVLEDISQMVNYSDKFLVLALFEGVRTEQIGELLRAKIANLQGNVLTFENGEKRILTEDLVRFAKSSASEEFYVSVTGNSCSLNVDGCIINSRKNIRNNSMEHLNKRAADRLGTLRRQFNIPYLTISRLNTAGIVNDLNAIIAKYNIPKEKVFDKEYFEMVGSNYQITYSRGFILKNKFYCFL